MRNAVNKLFSTRWSTTTSHSSLQVMRNVVATLETAEGGVRLGRRVCAEDEIRVASVRPEQIRDHPAGVAAESRRWGHGGGGESWKCHHECVEEYAGSSSEDAGGV